MDEDHRFILGQHDIRLARQIFHVQAKAVTHAMQQPADDEFRARVLPADSPHIPTAAFRR